MYLNPGYTQHSPQCTVDDKLGEFIARLAELVYAPKARHPSIYRTLFLVVIRMVYRRIRTLEALSVGLFSRLFVN